MEGLGPGQMGLGLAEVVQAEEVVLTAEVPNFPQKVLDGGKRGMRQGREVRAQGEGRRWQRRGMGRFPGLRGRRAGPLESVRGRLARGVRQGWLWGRRRGRAGRGSRDFLPWRGAQEG